MRDVADRAGVALKTVSRVVNNESGVSDLMARRVHLAIETLGYRPHSSASSLRRNDNATASIGLVLEDIGNPFSSQLHRSIEDVARSNGYLVLAGSSDEAPLRERELVDMFCGRRVDGLIVVPSGSDHDYLQREMQRGMPVVLVDRTSASVPDADSVVCDNEAGAHRATAHLLAHGHTRLLFLGDSLSIATAVERRAGFRAALQAAGLEPAGEVSGLRTSSAAEAALLSLLDPRNSPAPERPTAVFAGQNLISIGAIRALHRLGLQHRVALVGFDDFPMADLISPGVSVVAQQPTDMGRIAASTVLRRIKGDVAPPIRAVVPTRLIERGSGELSALDATVSAETSR